MWELAPQHCLRQLCRVQPDGVLRQAAGCSWGPVRQKQAALAVQWGPIFAQDSDTRRGRARDMVRDPSLHIGHGTSRGHIFSKENFAAYRELMTSKCSLPRWGGRQGIPGPQECCPCDEGEHWCHLLRSICVPCRDKGRSHKVLRLKENGLKGFLGKEAFVGTSECGASAGFLLVSLRTGILILSYSVKFSFF